MGRRNRGLVGAVILHFWFSWEFIQKCNKIVNIFQCPGMGFLYNFQKVFHLFPIIIDLEIILFKMPEFEDF